MSLPEPVRRRLSSFSRTVFTDNNRTGPDNRSDDNLPDNELVSNLPLQMSLYFNLCFFPFWWVSSVVMLQLKVPELAGFWLLSLFLQLPLILFLLLNEGLKIQPLERAVHVVFVAFLVFQVVAAFLALKKMVNQLATRFRLREFDRLDNPLPAGRQGGPKARPEAPWAAGFPMEEIQPTSVGWGSAVKA
ncbi:transmembrane protein 17 isoform X2 [Heteronotia binoei]|uniref:transmembrane protein 17 isoform X2 n=1 Tax=Heteronotia binoei TaxID=13085 RepID=UPI00292CB657|nr:transmembrane protein 17 isoform X2 [Heteronotia binoei]